MDIPQNNNTKSEYKDSCNPYEDNDTATPCSPSPPDRDVITLSSENFSSVISNLKKTKGSQIFAFRACWSETYIQLVRYFKIHNGKSTKNTQIIITEEGCESLYTPSSEDMLACDWKILMTPFDEVNYE